MDKQTIDKLLALNRVFYSDFAEHFAASRSLTDPALTSILPYLPQCARILDVGCGNGRLALLLDRERPGSTYVGVDVVPELIEEARAATRGLSHTEVALRVLDVTRLGWTERLPPAPPSTESVLSVAEGLRTDFDCVVALALLHHIPDFELRAQVVRGFHEVLTPGGYAILSTWRFLSSERMRRKIVDWDEVDVDERELEPGDYLLDWKRGGRGLRYCHMVDEEEMAQLAAASGFRVRQTFRAGGREGDLSLFAILDKGEACC